MLWCAVAMLLVPFRWLLAWYLAVAVHELGHIVCVWMLHIPIYEIKVETSGAQILTAPMTPKQMALSALAGPAAAAATLLLGRVCPELSFCALLQTVYNLLPCYPMDGGRVLWAICCWLFNRETADKILSHNKSILVLTILLGAVAAMWRVRGAYLAVVLLLLGLFSSKIFLANRNGNEYNRHI